MTTRRCTALALALASAIAIALALCALPARADIVDIAAGGTIHLKCPTTFSFVPTTLAGSPVVSIYKDGSLTQTTTGVTLTVDFDGVTGLNDVGVDTSSDGTFYAAGSTFSAVVTTGTVGGVSVVGNVCGEFAIQRSTISAVSGAVGSVSGNVGGNVSGNVGGNVVGSTASVTGNVGGNVVGSVGSVSGNVGGNVTGTVASVVGNVGGNVTGSVASVAGNVSGNLGGNVVGSVGSVASGGISSSSFASGAITAASIAPDAIGASELADDALDSGALATSAVNEIVAAIPTPSSPPSAATISDAVWDELLAGHAGAGSAGAALSAAGGSGDPWTTALPASYADGTAGHIIGNIVADLSSTGVTIVSPFDPTTGKLRLTRGDDYPADEDGAIPAFTSTSWPDLTGAVVRLTIRKRVPGTGLGGDVLLTILDTSSLRSAGGASQSVTFEPLSVPGDPVVNSQVGGTASLVPGVASAKFDIEATLASGAVKTLAAGLVDVVEDITHD